MRMMSRESANMVYHRPECKYVQKIHRKNRMKMEWEEAEWRGYRPCKCCDNVRFLYHMELENIEYFARQNNIDVDLKNNKIYVRTDVGCWKIVYRKSIQRFILLHRNYVNGRIDLDNVDNAPYHRQGDMAESGSIVKYLKYIKKHDDFKQNLPMDYRQMPQNSRKQKMYYKSAKKRAQKRSSRQLDMLFALVERQENIKEFSFC
ncbi:MAG: hypothetical protein NC313_12795 [Butyrivibrio sp.]|nr:hypothetical protein [Butyrivibrio sp.]